MTDMQEAWSRLQYSLPPALTTQESLWLRPDGVVYLDGLARYRVLDTGDGWRVEDLTGKGFALPLTEKYREVIADHIIGDAFGLLKKQSGMRPEQADKCLARGPLDGNHLLCWFGPGPRDTWGRVLTDLDEVLTFDQALKETRRALSALAVEHAFTDLHSMLKTWVRARSRNDPWLSSMDLHSRAEATLELVEDGTGITRFLVYLTSDQDGIARARFVDGAETKHMHFRVGTGDGGLGDGYDDLMEAISTALDRLGGRG
jgi:hypothetical protein